MRVAFLGFVRSFLGFVCLFWDCEEVSVVAWFALRVVSFYHFRDCFCLSHSFNDFVLVWVVVVFGVCD